MDAAKTFATHYNIVGETDSSNNVAGDGDQPTEKQPGQVIVDTFTDSLTAKADAIEAKVTDHVMHGVAHSWLWQLLALIFSFLCSGLVGLILHYENHKEPDTLGFDIDSNSLVSLTGTGAKSSFLLVLAGVVTHLKWRHFRRPQRFGDLALFDASTQSEVGSLNLLVARWRKSLLASIAAVIAILSFFTDFTWQQTIGYVKDWRPTSSPPPAFTHANVYDPNFYTMRSMGDDPATAVNSNMQGAILDGLYFELDPAEAYCYSDRCTWPEAVTLGVCVSCADVLQSSHTIGCDALTPFENDTFTATSCSYDVAGFTHVGASGSRDADLDIGFSQTLWNSTGSALALVQDQALAGGPQEALLANFTAIGLESPDNPTAVTPQLPLSQSLQCQYYLCGKIYKNMTIDPNITMELPPPTLNATLNIVNRTNSVNDSYTSANQSFLHLEPVDRTALEGNHSLVMNEADYLSLGAYLAQIFTTAYSSDGSVDRSGVSASGQAFAQTRVSTPAIGRSLSDPDMNATWAIHNVADTMSETMRTDQNATDAVGTGEDQVTIIKVKWAWLAFPVSLQVGTLILFVTVFAAMKRDGEWRRSEPDLEVLMHGLQGMEEVEEGQRGQLEEIQVRLVKDGDGTFKLKKS